MNSKNIHVAPSGDDLVWLTRWQECMHTIRSKQLTIMYQSMWLPMSGKSGRPWGFWHNKYCVRSPIMGHVSMSESPMFPRVHTYSVFSYIVQCQNLSGSIRPCKNPWGGEMSFIRIPSFTHLPHPGAPHWLMHSIFDQLLSLEVEKKRKKWFGELTV